ncbi:tRNA (adenosine(37)-N6)-threonylcarbamoyltransferase complex dimerization subunit type 1 TsaB [Flectobacillus rivi]|uniref:tRNA (Adenosine(37)-N6)-threonylcarbamoyltransferase complex dimerization subunit type 1 TsaB n=1 Tax=Flectobacillus rivi TaxID=2984209 RepID=A0ABT6Z0L2_9BACT|nr:tRNA (adenosine(37)-N6)-threonylcarbamoyltransferase complex dimerization subunit type 1 TsaB [Flectobacillus rivi]MDI9874665.1 tRNA (adenosine(37)-N6)-threonylcarbamoyltransferase complex dimerization subunit type 1 TsaB [Flectobacillus rivi]
MSLIVSIDTSTKVCSVALHKEGKLLGLSELFTEKSHSGMLTTLVENVVKQAGYELSQLDAIAVAKGPGSYTGLRIGVSTAKGLSFALDKPLLSVNTLEAMAAQLKDMYGADTLLCPMIDARRMEVYCGVWNTEMGTISEIEAKIIDETAFISLLEKQPIVFFGDGAAKCKSQIAHPNAHFPNTELYPSARTVGVLAHKAFQEQAFENVVSFEPFYLKDFVGTTPKAAQNKA